jgi:hypothetical protein
MVSHYGGEGPAGQHVGLGPSTFCSQYGDRQVDLQGQVQGEWLSGPIQGSLGPPWVHPVPRVEYDETFSSAVKPAPFRLC